MITTNPYIEMGYRNADAIFLRVQLSDKITEAVVDRDWSRTEAAKRWGVDRELIDRLLDRHVDGVSDDELLSFFVVRS